MDRSELIKEGMEMLKRAPPYIASASIKEVRDFKTWHTKTTKKLASSKTLSDLQSNLREIRSIYQRATAVRS